MSFISCRLKALIPPRPSPPAGPSRADRVKTVTQYHTHRNTHRRGITQLRKLAYSLNSLLSCVLLQAVLNFHKQVGNTVAILSEQYEELFGASCNLPQDLSEEQMMIQLMSSLNISGQYFAFKEQIKVRTKACRNLEMYFRMIW